MEQSAPVYKPPPNPAIVRQQKCTRTEVTMEIFIESLEDLLPVSKEDFNWRVEAVKKELDRLQLQMLNGE